MKGPKEVEYFKVFCEQETDKISKELDGYFLVDDRDIVLYHYTSMNSLNGIIKSKKIWMTESSYLNDPEENFWINKKIMKNSENDENLRDLLDFFNIKNNLLFDYEFSKNEIIFENSEINNELSIGVFLGRYVFSMSELADDLTQWRSYGDHGNGVCLGFSVKEIEKYKFIARRPIGAAASIHRNVKLFKVIYDNDLQNEFIDKIQYFMKNIYKKIISDFSKNEELKKYCIRFSSSKIKNILYKMRMIFKSDSFSSEKEWRLSVDLEAPLFDIESRSTVNELITYVEFPAYLCVIPRKDMAGLILNKLTVGPKVDLGRFHRAWETLVTFKLGNSAIVEKSSIKMR
jgi:hypothetical protein